MKTIYKHILKGQSLRLQQLRKQCQNSSMRSPRHSSSTPSSSQHQQREENLDSYLVKSYLKPSHLNSPHTSATDYGTFNQYKLDDLIDLQGDGFNEHRVIRLAFVENNSIHLEEEGIELFQKYAKNQIAFVGAYGRTEAGKSLMLDKLINLCEFAGSYFSSKNRQEKGLYLWSIPFSKGNLKVFMLDIDGYSRNQDSSYFMLFDMMLLLSSSLMVLAEPNDYSFDQLSNIYKHVKKSRSRFKCSDEKQDSFWPSTIYCLFRRQISITKGLQSIIKMFAEFNFTVVEDAMDQISARSCQRQELLTAQLTKYGKKKKIISNEYIKRVSGVMRDIMMKIQPKSYLNLRYTGANLIKLTVNAAQYLNLKNYLNIDKLFHKSMKELYSDAYSFHTQLYNQSLIGYLSEEEPMEVDYLLKAFQSCSQEILNSFNTLKVNQKLKEQYSQKLEKYINDKEKMVMQINKKKSRNKAKIAVPDLPSKPEIKELTQFISIAKKAPKNYEQIYSQELMPQITSGLKFLQKKYKNQRKDTELRQKSIQVHRKIEARSKELEQIRRNKSKKQSEASKSITLLSNFQVKQKKLKEVLKTLKSQCIQSKAYQSHEQKELKSSKSAQMLKAEEQVLRRERQKKERMIQQLKAQSPSKNIELISKLQSKISEKINQQRDLQNMLNSNMKIPTVHVLKSTTSINSPRKAQSRAFDGANSNIRIIPSPKA